MTLNTGQAIITLISLVVTVPLLMQALYYVYLWQVKEYRLDRILAHFYDNAANSVVERSMVVAKFVLLLLLWLALVIGNNALLLSAVAVFTIYAHELQVGITKAIKGRMRRPVFTNFRAIFTTTILTALILLPTIYSIVWLSGINNQSSGLAYQNLTYQQTNIAPVSDLAINKDKVADVNVVPLTTALIVLQLSLTLLVDLALFPLASFGVGITWPLARYSRKKTVNAASRKISQSGVKVIGITGSYGKTTTKELVAQTLAAKFEVCKTEKNNNTAIGIAKIILQKIKDNTQIFVAEMGAYTKNEVGDSAKLARPDIAIVTGLESQHLHLFGNFENLYQAKREIITNAKEGAAVVLNADNEHVLRMGKDTANFKIMYTISNPDLTGLDNFELLKAKDIVVSKQGKATFTAEYQGKTQTITANVSVAHNVSNLLAALACAMLLGLSLEEAGQAISSTNYELPYLRVSTNSAGVKLIDDGYNSSVSGFKSALKFMAGIDDHKANLWAITKGIIELGFSRDQEYAKIIDDMSLYGVGLITSDKNLHNMAQIGNVKSIYVKEPFNLGNIAVQYIKKGDVLLVEGAMPQKVLGQLQQ